MITMDPISDPGQARPEDSDTHHKALHINLEESLYGVVAEIGAGQETAAWFFRVGGAAGTVAKSMSAYDMQFSDEIYGRDARYVSRDRLEKMLDHEYGLLQRRLGDLRGERTAFFAFANTVAARSYQGDNICHGWVGLRFQAAPRAAPDTILLHVNMLDETNLAQQQALGVLGVNLIYGAYFQRVSLNGFLCGLLDGLTGARLEIDYARLDGPSFNEVDARGLGLELLRCGLARAVLFSPGGAVDEPLAALYKRPLVVVRGAYRIVKPVHDHMLQAGLERLEAEDCRTQRPPAGLFEMSIDGLQAPEAQDNPALLARIDRLLAFGRPVLATAYPHTYHLTGYLRRYTREPLRFSMGLTSLVYHLSDAYYQDLEGGILEAVGRLIARKVRLYVFPMPVERVRERMVSVGFDQAAWELPASGDASLSNAGPRGPLRHLYSFLVTSGALVEMPPIPTE